MSDEPMYHDIAEVEAIPSGSSAGIQVEDQRIALFNYEGQFYATQNSCPHMGASLAGGPMLKGGRIRCMLHGWVLNFNDCEEEDGLRRFPVKVENGRVLVCPKPIPSDQQPVSAG
jgi:nitrite reductase/ring-hydroxylating ferredoxin subunit